MGYWGYKLFESDHDMELLGEVLQDSAEMLGYEEKLSDSGAFHLALSSNRGQGLGRMIDKYEKDPEKTGSGRDHKIILLVAYAMERGVQYLDNDFRQKVRAKNEKLGITKEARAQMREALDKFKPCKPWKFESLGLQDTIAKFEAERRAKGIPEDAPGGVNVVVDVNCCPGHTYSSSSTMAVKSLIDNLPRKQHRLVEEFIEAQQRGSRPSQEAVQAMRDCFGAASSSVLGVEDSTGMVDGALSAIMSAMSHNEEEERATRACAACGKDEDDVGGGKLKQCAKCHSDKTFYCSRDCQKNDWKDHKRICGKKVPLPPTRFVGTQFGSESATVYHGF